MESLPRDDLAALLRENELLRARITELEAQQALIQEVLAHLPDVIARFDRALRHTYVSPSITQVTGLHPSVFLGKTNRDLKMPQHLIELWDAMLNHVLTLGEPIRFTFSFIGTHGEQHYEAYYVPEFAADGSVKAVVSMARDVTERVQVEQQLLDSQTLLQSILDHAPATIVVKDRQGRFQLVSQNMLTLLGLTHMNQLLGKTDADLWPPDICAQLRVDDQQVFTTGAALQREYEFPLSSSMYCVLSMVFPIYDRAGQVSAVGSISTDITEHKQTEAALLRLTTELEARVADRTARLTETVQRLEKEAAERIRSEAALRESQRFVEQIAAISPIILSVYDIQSQRVVYANTQLAAFLGYPVDHITVPAMSDWLHPEDLAALPLLRTGYMALADGESFEYEYRIRDAGGGWHYLATRGIVFARTPEGRVGQILVAALDVTARRQAEEEVQRYHRRLVEVQEAEQAHLARELHDEIGQILTGLNLVLEAGMHGGIAIARRQIREAQTLVNDLTTRVRQLSLDLRPAMLDDLGLLPAVAWLVKRYTQQTGVQVQVQHSALATPIAATMAITAYRVVQEALTNVARHAETGDAKLQLWTTNRVLYVQVTDAGRGFDVAHILATTTSTGLAGMRERVHLLGGSVTIDSAPGSGTRIVVELPLS